MCLTMQEDPNEQVNGAGGFHEPFHRKYDPFFNSYNPGSKDHTNLKYGGNSKFQQNYPPRQSAQLTQSTSKKIAEYVASKSEKIDSNINELQEQMSQIAYAVSIIGISRKIAHTNSCQSQAEC